MTLTPAITAYADGMVVNFEAGATNTAAMTLNVNSVGAHSLVMPNGDAPPAGAVTSGNFYTAIYDLTNTQWILMSGNHIHAGINVIAADTTTDAVSIAATSITTGSALDISSGGTCLDLVSTSTGADCISLTANSLTNGNGLSISSNSSSTGARNLISVHNDNPSATGAVGISILQDAPALALGIAAASTTGDSVSIVADSLTTGSALSVYSNSSDSSTRNLSEVNNDNTSATGTRCLALNNDANARCLFATSANTTDDNVVITSNSLTTGSALSVTSNSSSSLTRSVVSIVNDNTSASSAACLSIQQDSTGRGIQITSSNSRGLEIISGATTADSLAVNADSLTTGTCLTATSNSSDSSSRNLVEVENQNASATGSKCLVITQAASSPALRTFCTDASFSNNMCQGSATRSGSSAFSFAKFYSSVFSDTEFSFSGDGNGTCDGSFSGGGADYAEYFEWEDGNPNNEDRRGFSVSLKGNKIVKATDKESCIGVISGNPSYVGDSAWNKWSGKHLRDDYGSYIMEDYKVLKWNDEDGNLQIMDEEKLEQIPKDAEVIIQQRRKLNPKWNADEKYIPRSERKEWDTVGLVGKLRIRKGQPVNPNWIKMRDISEEVEEWLVL